MVALKPGVNIAGLRPEIVVALIAAESVFGDRGVVVTSAKDGKHRDHSRHYLGQAIDIRTRHLTDKQKKEFAELLQVRLGDDFDVVLESSHMHLEFDP